jgi:hypothetical protein
MNPTIFLMAIVVASSHVLQLPQSPPLTVYSDEFHLGGLISELMMNDALQERIDLSPDQREKIKQVISSKDFRKLHTKISFAPEDVGDELMDVDRAQHELFREVLTPAQLVRLKQVFYAAKYANDFKQTVCSEFVIKYCGIRSQRKEFRQVVDNAVNSSEKVVKSYKTQRVRQLLSAVPPEYESKLVQLVGLKYFPADKVSSEVDFDQLPFPEGIRTLGMIGYLTDAKLGLANQIQLSQQQKAAMLKIIDHSELDIKQHMAASRDAVKSSREFEALNQREATRAAEYIKLLSNKQKLIMGRFAVQSQLERDPTLLFQQQGIQTYLGMDEKSWDSFTKVVQETAEMIQKETNSQNKLMLGKVGKEMGPDISKRLHYLLGDAW